MALNRSRRYTVRDYKEALERSPVPRGAGVAAAVATAAAADAIALPLPSPPEAVASATPDAGPQPRREVLQTLRCQQTPKDRDAAAAQLA